MHVPIKGRTCDLSIADHVSTMLGSVLTELHLGPGLHYTSPLWPNKLLVPGPPPYRDPPLNCANFSTNFQRTELAHPVFEGGVSFQHRMLLDVTLINNEIDILEARMYELNHVVDYFVVAESAYTHRGVKKLRLLERSMKRLTPFHDKLILIDIDKCAPYMEAVQVKRASFSDPLVCSKDDWPIQNAMRNCMWPLIQEKIDTQDNPLADDAMIIFGDLDEIPAAPILKHVRHCVPRGGDYSQHYFIRLQSHMVHRPNRKNMKMHEIGTGVSNWNVWVQSISYPRQHGKLAFRSDEEFKDVKHKNPMLYGGFHLQGTGSLAHYLYREFSHAEGGLSIGGFIGRPDGPFAVPNGFCNITTEMLANFQIRFQRHPEHFHWRYAKQNPVYEGGTGGPSPEPTEKELNDLQSTYFPWIMIENRDRYPFLWGRGTLDMYSIE